MIIRIITQADDIIVHSLVPHLVIEVEQDVDLGHALGVQDNLGARALLAAGPSGSLKQIGKSLPVGLITAVALLELGSRSPHRPPEHTITDLVTRLDIVGRRPNLVEGLKTVARVLIDAFCQRGIVECGPIGRRVLLDRVGPTVAIVEVEHELQASLLDAASQHLDGVQILYHPLALLGRGGIGGIDKQTHTRGIPALLLDPCDDVIDALSIEIIVVRIADAILQRLALMVLILGEHRDVAPHQWTVIDRFHNGTAQDSVNHRADVGDIDLAIAIGVTGSGSRLAVQDHVDNITHVSDVDLAIAIGVACCHSTGAEGCQRQCYQQTKRFCHLIHNHINALL